jgi:hypothetical protein
VAGAVVVRGRVVVACAAADRGGPAATSDPTSDPTSAVVSATVREAASARARRR